jgi:Ca2+-binding RTX toxin-like protein/cytochrome c5
LRGIEGYFAFDGVGSQGQIPTVLDAVTSTQVSFRAPTYLGRINFFGQDLTVVNVTLPNGTVFPTFSGGTITGIEFLYNYRLSDAIDQGIGDTTVLQSASFLEPSASLSLPNVPATTLANAILQSYRSGSTQPFENFINADNFFLTGTNRTNLIAGFNGDDILIGLGGNDILNGNGGNDILDGGAGTDGLNGGPGNDLYLPGPPAPDTPIGDGISDSGTNPNEIDTVSYANATGPVAVDLNLQDGDQSAGWALGAQIAGVERVIGSRFNDILYGSEITASMVNNAVDTLEGGAGDDTLVGFAGSDFLQGGPGFDLLFGGSNDSINAPGPGDTARFNASSQEIAVFYQQDGSVLVAAPGGGVDRLVGMEFLGLTDGVFNIGSFAQSSLGLFVGDDGNNPLNGSAGNDLIFGRGGSDTIRGGDGNDTIEGGGENNRNVIFGDNGNDLILTGSGGDSVSGGNGNDIATGGAGNDTLNGDAGNDILNGGAGNDRLVGGQGQDTATFNASVSHTIRLGLAGAQNTGEGLDTLIGVENLVTGNGRDQLHGDSGANVLRSGGAGDHVFGDAALASYYGSNAANQVFRLYQATLDREPDLGGHAAWAGRIATGERTLLEVADGFVRSAEFTQIYSASLTNTAFVTLLYNNILGNAPDARGLARWTGELEAGASRAKVVIGLSESPQNINQTTAAANAFAVNSLISTWSDDVFRLYQATLDRLPDVNGHDRWAGELSSGESTLLQVAEGFVGSPQFNQIYSNDLTDAAFVALLYQNVLDRDPDDQGFARWTGELAAGASFAEVVLGFSQSPQFVGSTAPALKQWMRSLGEHDRIDAGAGNNFVAGGQFADVFVFNAADQGSTTVVDFEAWDSIQLNGFGYSTKAEVRQEMNNVGNNLVFDDQGIEIIFHNANRAEFTDDMILV